MRQSALEVSGKDYKKLSILQELKGKKLPL